MRGSRSRDGIARNEGDGEPRSRSTSFDQHFRSHVASPGSTPSRGGRRRLEGRSVPRAGAEEPAVTSDGSTIFALSEWVCWNCARSSSLFAVKAPNPQRRTPRGPIFVVLPCRLRILLLAPPTLDYYVSCCLPHAAAAAAIAMCSQVSPARGVLRIKIKQRVGCRHSDLVHRLPPHAAAAAHLSSFPNVGWHSRLYLRERFNNHTAPTHYPSVACVCVCACASHHTLMRRRLEYSTHETFST